MIAACRGGRRTAENRAPPAPSRGPSADARDPWVQVDATPDTPEARSKRAAAALARVATIMPKLAALRGLTFQHDIPREYQAAEDFKKFVHTEISKEMPPTKAADISAALFQLGLLPTPGNLAELEEQAFTTQAGAYYDPATKKFFLVMVPDSEIMLDTISAHELTHGLQDQHFDLQRYMPSNPDGSQKLDDDAATARRFVAEGDATFTMFLYEVAGDGGRAIDPMALQLLRGQIESFAKLSPEEMVKQQAAGFSSMDPEIKKSIDAMGEIPLTVMLPMFDSYMQGAVLCMTAFDHGGWKGVDALYADPPESTEQVMHPATKLYPHRDHPHRVTLPPIPAGSTEVYTTVLGELQWLVYFSLWAPDQRTVASEGWGGDRASVSRRKDGRLIARIASVWDTAADASELAHAYVASLAKRFPGATGDPLTTGLARPGNAGKIFIKLDGARVYIVDGADDAAALAELIRGANISSRSCDRSQRSSCVALVWLRSGHHDHDAVPRGAGRAGHGVLDRHVWHAHVSREADLHAAGQRARACA